MKTKTSSLLIAAFIGFLSGCVVMSLVLPRGMAPAKTSAPDSFVATKRDAQTQTENVRKLSTTADAQTTASHSAERRRVLAEIRRNKIAAVDVPFFTKDTWYESGVNRSLSQQFIDFFELTPAQAGELSDLVKKAKDEMWNAEKAQVQVTPTDTGGIVIKIPPVAAGPDIYDKVMGGFRTVLGDERYNDMMLYDQITNTRTNQFEDMFDAFGAQVRTITIEKNDDGTYKITSSDGTTRYSIPHLTLDEFKQHNPELVDFLPTEWHQTSWP